MYIKLEDIKKHLNIEDCYNEDNQYLISLYHTATDVLTFHTDRTIESLVVGGELLPTARHAILLLIGQYYSFRESVTPSSIRELPLGFEFLCNKITNFSCSKDNRVI